MNITRKITIGYIVFILIPVLAFGSYYYSQIYGSLSKQFAESRQKILEQAYANMRMDFTRIQSLHRVLQYHSSVTDYLDGAYESESESVYSFIRHIRPLFTQSLFANTEIDSLVIYKMKDNVFPIKEHFVDISHLDSGIKEDIQALKPGHGRWLQVNPEALDSELVYYQFLYNTQFTEKIGLIEIRVNDTLIKKFYEAAGVKEPWVARLVANESQSAELRDSAFSINREHVINQLVIKELGASIVITGNMGDVFHSLSSSEVIMILIIFLLLIGLSLVYYVYASKITKRIMRLARHMRTLRDDNLRQNIIKQGKIKENDEIGFLVETYNSMLLRMDELIYNVHRVELLNKEAAYKVLQAQIKPHFLYNTLETIRMLAETNNDQEVADISFWFGKLMRYSLSADSDEITLAKEFEMAKIYLDIHMMRLQSRLTYEMEISIQSSEIICPKFIIQPLIENSIIHAVSTVIRPVHIRIVAEEQEQELRLSIIDNGKCISPDKLSHIKTLLSGKGSSADPSLRTGVGLLNVNERVKAFFGGTSRLEVDSDPEKGTHQCIIVDRRKGGHQ